MSKIIELEYQGELLKREQMPDALGVPREEYKYSFVGKVINPERIDEALEKGREDTEFCQEDIVQLRKVIPNLDISQLLTNCVSPFFYWKEKPGTKVAIAHYRSDTLKRIDGEEFPQHSFTNFIRAYRSVPGKTLKDALAAIFTWEFR